MLPGRFEKDSGLLSSSLSCFTPVFGLGFIWKQRSDCASFDFTVAPAVLSLGHSWSQNSPSLVSPLTTEPTGTIRAARGEKGP